MVAGLTDRGWTVADILKLMEGRAEHAKET
jgi:hypothetical protein